MTVTVPLPAHEPRFMQGLLWVGCLAVTCGVTVADPDLWGHTLYGLRALELQTPAEPTDPFSYTAFRQEWINHEWLAESQMGWLWKHLGNPGLVLWRNLLVLAVFLCGWRSWVKARGGLSGLAVLWAFTALCLGNFVVFVRPQLVTFALFALTLHQLNQFGRETSWKQVAGLPLLMVFWVNSHGGFLAGLGLVSMFCLAWTVRAWKSPEDRRPALTICGCCLLCGLATLINPYGWQLHEMLWYHLGSEQCVREWMPLWAVRQSPGYYAPFVLLLTALPAGRRISPVQWLVIAVVASQAVCHIRHIALLSITLLILLPGALSAALDRLFSGLIQQWSRPGFRPLRLGGGLLLTAFLVGLPARDAWTLWQAGIGPWDIGVRADDDPPGVPLRALAALRQAEAEGNIVTDYGWGQCAIWHLYPRCRVGFDGRYRTVYSADLEREFLAFQVAGRERPARTWYLDEAPTDFVLLPAGRGPAAYLEQRPDWVCAYQDAQSRLYVRRSAGHQELIRRLQAAPAELKPVAGWERFPGLQASAPPLAAPSPPRVELAGRTITP